MRRDCESQIIDANLPDVATSNTVKNNEQVEEDRREMELSAVVVCC